MTQKTAHSGLTGLLPDRAFDHIKLNGQSYARTICAYWFVFSESKTRQSFWELDCFSNKKLIVGHAKDFLYFSFKFAEIFSRPSVIRESFP